jgi:hypothetical protein
MSFLSKEVSQVISSLEAKEFDTNDFIRRFGEMFPAEWAKVVKLYGTGGSNSGKSYTAFVWAGQMLRHRAQRGEITKLEYSLQVPDGWGSSVIRRWRGSYTSQNGDPDEVSGDQGLVTEGAKKTITVNAYERDTEARSRCISRWGAVCAVCNFDFEARYGSHGKGYIHVHHLKPLSKIGRSYQLNPETDLRPVCPNCHAMLHRGERLLTIAKLKKMLRPVDAQRER